MRSAEEEAGFREHGLALGLCSFFDLRNAEIRNFHAACSLLDEIRRFDVAVNDSLSMRVDQSFEEALCNGDGFRNGKGTALVNDAIDRLPIDKLHHQNRAGIPRNEFEEPRDVTMAELREDLGLLDEALPRCDFARQLVRHDFQHHQVAFRQDVGCGDGATDVDMAHAAFAKLPFDAVISDDGPDHLGSSSFQSKPMLNRERKRNFWRPTRMMSRFSRSRRGSSSAPLT